MNRVDAPVWIAAACLSVGASAASILGSDAAGLTGLLPSPGAYTEAAGASGLPGPVVPLVPVGDDSAAWVLQTLNAPIRTSRAVPDITHTAAIHLCLQALTDIGGMAQYEYSLLGTCAGRFGASTDMNAEFDAATPDRGLVSAPTLPYGTIATLGAIAAAGLLAFAIVRHIRMLRVARRNRRRWRKFRRRRHR